MKSIVLCADDYGQEEAISKGILSLVAKDRLSAVSCMVTNEDWQEHANWLLPFKNRLDVGLHFNLTEGKPLTNLYGCHALPSFKSLKTTLLQTHLGMIKTEAVLEELRAQVTRFKTYWGSDPDFIDGHQHVHQFPSVRNAVILYYKEHLAQDTYLRWVNLSLSWQLRDVKKWLIYFSGTQALGKLLRRYEIPHNRTFSGCYNFNDAHRYAEFFEKFLTEVDDRGLIMCHPGFGDVSPIMNKSRKLELSFFASQQFLEICNSHQIKLKRFQM